MDIFRHHWIGPTNRVTGISWRSLWRPRHDFRALAVAAALIVAPSVASADGQHLAPSPGAEVYCGEPAMPLWTGVYLGTNIGRAWSDPNWQFPFVEAFNTTPGQSFTPSASGWIWGGHLGLNYQIHHFLIGAEASYAGNRLNETTSGAFAAGPTDQFVIEATDLFTATGRTTALVNRSRRPKPFSVVRARVLS
jgi:hypothetical protein